ncbi:hypothetical protein VKT23_019627 [Stygiomarasmius scandens]|uniref:Uncharacterized protein n=1 Tax=Marasmiellus scandens TaxID=2682957 RepID=A0ABR1IKX1_9AGAR
MNSFNIEKISTPLPGALRPVAAHSTGRYEKWGYSNPKSGVITPGFLYTHETNPQYLPPNWSSYVHPEGQLYFARDGPLRVVTELYMYSPKLMAKVLSWVVRIEDILEEKQIPFSENIELFIMLEDDDCLYYFVNHATRTQFWLEEVDTSSVGIPDYDSPSHLKLYLEELYWWHVEHFSMHLGGLPVQLIDELICIFSHAMTDHMTSRTSTFFYGEKDCKKFLKALTLARDHPGDGHQTCVVARLWKLVCSNRFQTHYGQEISRLSRDQNIIYEPSRPSRISRVTGALTFKTSDRYLAKLNDIFVDHLVYETEWKQFIASCLRDWKQVSFAAFSTLLLHLFLIFLESSRPLAITSAALLSASFLSSTLLSHRYDRFSNVEASEAYDHLEAIHSEHFGFEFIAFLYSLPKAFQLWGLLGLIANLFIMFGMYFGQCYALGAAIGSSLLLLWAQRLTSERTRFSFGGTSWRLRLFNGHATRETDIV